MLQVTAGNQKAFEKLYNKYKDKIMGYAFNMTRNKQPREIVSNTFMKVYKNRDSYSDEYKFSTWVWTIVETRLLIT